MFKKIAMFYFSGTGNTKEITKCIQDEIKLKQVEADCFSVDELLRKNEFPDVSQYDLVGFGFPVLGFGAPGILFDFLKKSPQVQSKKCFIYKTGGDYGVWNNAAGKRLKNKLTQKGFQVFHESIVAMPANWLMAYPDDLNKQIYLTAKNSKIIRIVSDILSDKEKKIKSGFLQHIFSMAINFIEEQCGARFYGLFHYSRKACNNCGTCIKNCPSGNLYETKGGKIRGKLKCFWCMRCVYSCPKKALTNVFSFFILKNGYNIRKIIQDPELKGEMANKDSKGMAGYMYKYISNPEIY